MPITETFSGFIETTTDALLVFEACRRGILPKISRRLHDRERGSIKSGTVFVFDEKESGIKRWTDGLVWSPSRILGNFLIYRELDGRESLYQKLPFEYDSPYLPQQQQQQQQPHHHHHDMEPLLGGELSNQERNRERSLVGSLTDTYKFRKGGLIKKTISIHLNGCTQHMISYYTRSDVLQGKLATPSSVSDLSNLQISPELLLKQSFRVPPSVEFAELMLKRPSLSPSSTNSSASTATATTTIPRISSHAPITTHHSLYEIQNQTRLIPESPLALDHSRRRSFDSRNYNRTSMDRHFLPCNEPRVVPPLSANTDRIMYFPPLPPLPHYLQQQQQLDVAAPSIPINNMHTRISNASPNYNRLSFDATEFFHGNRASEQQQRYRQHSVSNDVLTRSMSKEDVQEPCSSPYPRHYDSNHSSLYERNYSPSLPSPSSLIWPSTSNNNNASSSSSTNLRHSQQNYHENSRVMYYNRSSPPPLSHTATTSPLSLEPTSAYNSPPNSNTYYHHHHHQYNRQPVNNEKPSTIINSQNSIHRQLFSSGDNM